MEEYIKDVIGTAIEKTKNWTISMVIFHSRVLHVESSDFCNNKYLFNELFYFIFCFCQKLFVHSSEFGGEWRRLSQK